MMPELRGALAALFRCEDSEVLVEGRAGTSKTTGVLVKLLDRCRRYRGSRHLIVRATRRSMTDSILVTLDRLIGQSHPEVQRVNREQRHSYRLWGSEIVCRGLDTPEGLFSTEWDTVYAAEATEIEADAWQLFGRAMRHGATSYHQRIADCNPGAPGHWLNQRATPAADHLRDLWHSKAEYNQLQRFNHGPQAGAMRRLISVHPDNPAYWDAVAWGWRQLGLEMLAGLEAMSGHNRSRMLDGRWVAAEGAVYPEFNDAQHVISGFEVPREWPCFLAEDPGYDHPTAIVLATVAPNGRIYIVAEIVRRQTTIEQDARDITDRLSSQFNIVSKLGDPHYMFSANKHNSGETIAQQMRRYGHLFRPAPSARNQEEIAQQVEMVRSKLVLLGSDGRPMLQVFAGCQNVIRGFQTWGYERSASGAIKGGTDRFADVGDDEMDCVRMIISSQPTHDQAGIQIFSGVE
jgi:phage terminase large subunit